jgi:hypothetical protein
MQESRQPRLGRGPAGGGEVDQVSMQKLKALTRFSSISVVENAPFYPARQQVKLKGGRS